MLSLKNCAPSSPIGGSVSINKISMSLFNSSDIFQKKMPEIFVCLDTVRVLSMTFCMLQRDLGQNILLSLKICWPASIRLVSRSNPSNHDFAPNFWTFGLSRPLWQGYAHTKKVKAIKYLSVPKTFKQLRQFIHIINFYCEMWQKYSVILAPLTALSSKMSNTTGKTSTKNVLMLSKVE